jgi:transcriptional regulator with XRE-family HTH domain
METDGFGSFVRKRRTALGKSLRQFCRENSLDFGKMSRMERGLSPPPKTDDGLRLLGKSLQIGQDSDDWQRFSTLATVASGRIPNKILIDDSKARRLPAVLDRLEKTELVLIAPSGRFVGVRALNLVQWADMIDARSRLPELIRRLVHATLSSPEFVSFPAMEGVQRPGWDGLVKTEIGNSFVPTGVSGWEIGTDVGVLPKANEDYLKRAKDPLGIDPSRASFLFVTPRKWPDRRVNKLRWCEAKKKSGPWKDVRAYDCDDLEQWLETAPAVSIWLATLLGIRPPGVEDVDQYWQSVVTRTEPNLTPGVFLASREEERKNVIEWLAGPARTLALESRSPTEVVDFFCACLESIEEADRNRFHSRSVLVESREAWDTLRASKTPLVLVAKPQLTLEAEMITLAVRNGHHVLVTATHFSSPKINPMRLPRTREFELTKALRGAGFGEVEAAKAARAAGGSSTILKRQLTQSPDLNCPSWSVSERAYAATPFLWIGAWHSKCEADRTVVERFAGQPYEATEQQATALANCPEPLLMYAANRWGLLSKDDAWMLIGRFTTESQFNVFLQVAAEVLGEDDPKFDLPDAERWYADLRGKTPRFSGPLKENTAETLALLASLSETIGLPTTWNVSAKIDSIVRKVLPAIANWKRWASLGGVLPLLAEASPGSFLQAVELDIARNQSELVKLLGYEGDGLTGGCYHAGLLWALETIAWSPQYLARVCRVLLDLDSRDPGGRWGNRPKTTLSQIFLPWYPQTTATVAQRLQVIDRLIEHRADAAWPLLLSLLPEMTGGAAFPIQRPNWREWPTTWSPGATNAEIWEQVCGTSERLIEQAGVNVDRWCQLIEHIERLPRILHQRIINRLGILTNEGIDAASRKRLSDALRQKVQRHRAYRDARWSLPIDVVDSLENLQIRVEPNDAVLRYDWLFEDWPGSYMESDRLSPQEAAEELSRKQREAINEILSTSGIQGISELARRAKSPFTVGYALAQITSDQFLTVILPAGLVEGDEKLRSWAAGFIGRRFDTEGWGWVDNLPIQAWTCDAVAQLFATFFFSPDVLRRVEGLGLEVRDAYWRTARAFNPRLESGDVEYVVERLIEHERSLDAIRIVGRALHNKRSLSVESLLRPLEQALQLDEVQLHDNLTHFQYDIRRIFQHVQERDDVDEGRVASLEWRYLTLLDHGDTPPRVIHRWLSRKPEALLDVLKIAYCSRKPECEAKEISKATSAAVAQAHRLLHSWKTIPGQQLDGTIDSDFLESWVTSARKLADECGRGEICDYTIGQMLANSPKDGDGTWPCFAVRKVLERIASEDIEEGMHIGILNSRGATWRSPYEGGSLERQETEKYDSLAARIEIESPRTASVLRGIAASYRGRARREDEEAEWRF